MTIPVLCLITELAACALAWVLVLAKMRQRPGLALSLVIVAAMEASAWVDAHHDGLFRIGAVVSVVTLFGTHLIVRRQGPEAKQD